MLRLRLVSKAFDMAANRIILIKLRQSKEIHAKFSHEVDRYDPNHVLENLEMHLATLQHRLQKVLKRVNVGQSVCEFYTFDVPPDYIFYIGEVLGEAAGFIPLRVEDSSRHL